MEDEFRSGSFRVSRLQEAYMTSEFSGKPPRLNSTNIFKRWCRDQNISETLNPGEIFKNTDVWALPTKSISVIESMFFECIAGNCHVQPELESTEKSGARTAWDLVRFFSLLVGLHLTQKKSMSLNLSH